MKRKRLISAGVMRQFIFENEEAYNAYIRSLRGDYDVWDKRELPSGSIGAIIAQQYNTARLIPNIMRFVVGDPE